jgi:AcrR family transcriptional regulator
MKIKSSKSYHHGNLREALLEAAELELIEKGAEKFSLRGVAKRAGVSHAAPAPHFGDVTGLLSALASISSNSYDVLEAHVQAVLKLDNRKLEDEPDAAPMMWATTHGLASLFARRKRNGGPQGQELQDVFERILWRTANAI